MYYRPGPLVQLYYCYKIVKLWRPGRDWLYNLWVISQTNTVSYMFFVRFDSYALNSPEYIGPFDNEDDAYDYINARNGSLALSGVPTDVASYSVTNSWTKMTNQK